MSETTVKSVRGDADIQEAIDTLILRYPPSANDRHDIGVKVEDGVVILTGYTKSIITRRYLLENIPLLEGVHGIKSDYFFDDETIRLETGKIIPYGLFVNVEYGTVILTGKQPDDVEIEALVAEIGQVEGVRRVLVSLR